MSYILATSILEAIYCYEKKLVAIEENLIDTEDYYNLDTTLFERSFVLAAKHHSS